MYAMWRLAGGKQSQLSVASTDIETTGTSSQSENVHEDERAR